MNSIRRNVGLLAGCQAMLLGTNSTLAAVQGLSGLALAPYKVLATLPVTCWIIGGALATMPASFHMKRAGRQRGLTLGALWGIAGALVAATAMWAHMFWVLCAGSILMGVGNAYAQYYRFAAADSAKPEFRPTAISLVLAGGLVGGIFGPALSRVTVNALEVPFAGAYLGLIVFSLASMALLQFVRIPAPSAAEQAAAGRPLSVIAAQPKFLVAVASAAIGYGVMNFLMTSTPIAMQICGHGFGDAAFVISSHVIAMFAPSFFTGPLIKRVGVVPVLVTGAVLNFAAIATALAGITVTLFWVSLVFLGVGWNFLYIGGTTLLASAYRPEERAKAQGANDQAIFIMMTISSIASGVTVTTAGWERVNLAALPLVGLVTAALAWYALHERGRKAAAA